MHARLCLIAAVLVMGSGVAARADTFAFTYVQGNADGALLTESGTLTATARATPGQYTITGVSGTEVFAVGGTGFTSNITGLLSPDTVYQGDDILYTGGTTPYLDQNGFTFTTDGSGSDGSGDVNIAYLASQNVYTTPYEIGTQNGTFALSAVPEPASLTLALGFVGLGFVLRQGQRRG